MRGHTTTSGENTFGSSHTCEVLGRSLDTHEHHFLSVLVPSLGIVGMEYNLSAGSTRRCRQTLSDNLCLRESHLVEYRVEQFVELVGLATHDGSLLVNLSFVQQVDGNLHHSGTGTLAVTGLEEPELAFLYGELHVLHIAIVLLELLLDGIELSIDFRHSLFH